MIKKAYFQGTEEPAPKKKKYKADKTSPVVPRNKEPLYRNYDLYETEGVDGPAKQGPGAGFYQNMGEYKSTKEFIDKKRKLSKKAQTRIELLSTLLKIAIDFSIDDQINSAPILSDSGTYARSVPGGGKTDTYLSLNDFEGKSVDQLDIGRDYSNQDNESRNDKEVPIDDATLAEFMEKYLNPPEPELFLPGGISPISDLDADNTISNKNPYFDTTNMGNNTYDKAQI
jgi:hypothetical protein